MIVANRQDILEHLEQQFGLEVAELEVMLPQFLTAMNNYREDLLNCISTGNCLSIAKKAHRLKGACLTLGLNGCVALAYEIEMAAKEDNPNFDYLATMLKLDGMLARINE